MDQSELVKAGHIIVKALDDAGMPPSAALWVHQNEAGPWKLWIVPHASLKDKREFYRRLSDIVRRDRDELGGVDAADAEMVGASHPAIQALKSVVKMSGLGAAHFSNNRFNGFYLPDGIIMRMNV